MKNRTPLIVPIICFINAGIWLFLALASGPYDRYNTNTHFLLFAMSLIAAIVYLVRYFATREPKEK